MVFFYYQWKIIQIISGKIFKNCFVFMCNVQMLAASLLLLKPCHVSLIQLMTSVFYLLMGKLIFSSESDQSKGLIFNNYAQTNSTYLQTTKGLLQSLTWKSNHHYNCNLKDLCDWEFSLCMLDVLFCAILSNLSSLILELCSYSKICWKTCSKTKF